MIIFLLFQSWFWLGEVLGGGGGGSTALLTSVGTRRRHGNATSRLVTSRTVVTSSTPFRGSSPSPPLAPPLFPCRRGEVKEKREKRNGVAMATLMTSPTIDNAAIDAPLTIDFVAAGVRDNRRKFFLFHFFFLRDAIERRPTRTAT